MTLAVDPASGELVGPAGEIQAFLETDEAPGAARRPAFRIWTEGAAPGASVLGGPDASLLVTDRPGGERALLPLATEQLAVALAVWLGLGPRPVPDEPAIRLDPGAMAVLIGRGQAHGHGLEPEVARDLQRRLEAGTRHWALRFQAGGWRRNLEVLEGDGGIWRVRSVASSSNWRRRPRPRSCASRWTYASARGEGTGPRPHEAGRPDSPVGLSGTRSVALTRDPKGGQSAGARYAPQKLPALA